MVRLSKHTIVLTNVATFTSMTYGGKYIEAISGPPFIAADARRRYIFSEDSFSRFGGPDAD